MAMNQDFKSTFLTALEESQHKLLRLCSVYAEDADDKKDLFQESLINIWQSMPSFSGNSSLSTWMFRITLNVCLRLQTQQSKKRDRYLRLDSLTIEPANDECTHAEEQEQLVKLRNCIWKLDEADKAIITLYLEELSYKEISDITGLSENHVAVKIKRIKTKLMTCINETL